MTKAELNAFRRILENTRAELVNRNRSREALRIEASADEPDRNSSLLREVPAARGTPWSENDTPLVMAA
jgi:hypothetical protein